MLGAIIMMLQNASGVWMEPTAAWVYGQASAHRMSVPVIPVMRYSFCASFRTAWTSLKRPVAIRSETILDSATGRPAMEMAYSGV